MTGRGDAPDSSVNVGTMTGHTDAPDSGMRVGTMTGGLPLPDAGWIWGATDGGRSPTETYGVDAGSLTPLMTGVGGPGSQCTCTPGASRYCDSWVLCAWGIETCRPDGTWSACMETAPPADCTTPGGGNEYDEQCCARGNRCCETGLSGSIGNCAGVETCN
jgi:hypothetical protein